MNPFEFCGVGRIVFGSGKFAMAGELAAGLGKQALLIYNGISDIGPIVAQISKGGVKVTPCRQKGEPTVHDIDAALEQARQKNCDCVIGMGGGSAIDAAKAVAGILTNGGSVVDYMEVVGKGKKITRLAAPWMAIPMTAGTGAEVTRNAVIGFPEKKVKASIRSELLLARVALVDPELGKSVPPAVTASSGMDALCQCIESYTSTGASPMTNGFALQGMKAAADSLLMAYQDGDDLSAREEMAFAALLSGITLTNGGLGAVHGFAAPLGANFPVPHGTVCAALLPHVLAANIEALRQGGDIIHLDAYVKIGRILAQDEKLKMELAFEACVQETQNLVKELNIPPLKQFGMGEKDIVPMVELAKKSSSMRFNRVVLPDDVLGNVLRAGIG